MLKTAKLLWQCSFNKGFVLPDKLIHLSKTRVPNARGRPRGTLMPSPRAARKFRMPHLQDWQREQMPLGCPGEGWAPLELIDAYRWVFLRVVPYFGEPVGRVKMRTTSKNSQRYYTTKKQKDNQKLQKKKKNNGVLFGVSLEKHLVAWMTQNTQQRTLPSFLTISLN